MNRFICLILLVVFSFSAKAQKTKWTLAKVIKTRVIINDTTKIGTILQQYDSSNTLNEYIENNYEKYLERRCFYQLKESIYKIAKTKNAIVYRNGQRLTTKEIKELYTNCDSVEVLKCFGGKNEAPSFTILSCDSTSKIENISAINFYETWVFNEKNKMIEKEVLAYQLEYYDFDKSLYIPLFMVFKDEKSVKIFLGEH